MCNAACMEFANKLTKDDVEAKRVLEVGSFNVNGSMRLVAQPLLPSEYIGVDITEGPGVDEVCDVLSLTKRFGKESFDVVISSEMIEHVYDWRGAISNMKGVLKTGGVLLITTRSQGFSWHCFPTDWWRYEIADMERIFDDFTIEALERDLSAPGVFVLARKPVYFHENKLSHHALYSMIEGKRCTRFDKEKVFLMNIMELCK